MTVIGRAARAVRRVPCRVTVFAATIDTVASCCVVVASTTLHSTTINGVYSSFVFYRGRGGGAAFRFIEHKMRIHPYVCTKISLTYSYLLIYMFTM